jgi:hypothetical protein
MAETGQGTAQWNWANCIAPRNGASWSPKIEEKGMPVGRIAIACSVGIGAIGMLAPAQAMTCAEGCQKLHGYKGAAAVDQCIRSAEGCRGRGHRPFNELRGFKEKEKEKDERKK